MANMRLPRFLLGEKFVAIALVAVGSAILVAAFRHADMNSRLAVTLLSGASGLIGGGIYILIREEVIRAISDFASLFPARPFQFRMRTLFIAVTGFCILCGIVGRPMMVVRERKSFIANRRDCSFVQLNRHRDDAEWQERIPWLRWCFGDEPYDYVELPVTTRKAEREYIAALFPEATIGPLRLPMHYIGHGPLPPVYFLDDDTAPRQPQEQ